MRDESKAAAVGIFLSILLALAALLRPAVPLFQWRPTAAPPVTITEDPLPPGRFEDFIALYGPPTFEEQNEQGVLHHPPLFTKWLDYEPEHLRIAFVAAESPGNSRSWVLIAFLDAAKPEPISLREAGRRLRGRSEIRSISSLR